MCFLIKAAYFFFSEYSFERELFNNDSKISRNI